MKLADRYSMERLEKPVRRRSATRVQVLKYIYHLKNGQDKVAVTNPPSNAGASRGITRGAAYFKG